MVLTKKVGKERSFLRGLLLTVFTFGIYQWYWAYKAHHEVYQQFELERENRDEAIVWLVLGLLLPFLALVYYHKFVSNVQYVRARMRLPGGVSPGTFVGILIAAAAGAIVILLVGVGSMMATFGEPPPDGELTPQQEEELKDSMGALAGAYALAILVGVGLAGYAFYRLQSDVNDVWRWYDANMATFTGAAGPPPYAPPGAPVYSPPTTAAPHVAPYPPTSPYPPPGEPPR